MPTTAYLFQSARLGFRPWREEDLEAMHKINADPEVMRYFPKTQDRAETLAFIHRMQDLQRQKGHCFFAVETLDKGEFIGFIGMSIQDFEAEFTPLVDLGWRLKPSVWGLGYATEGAEACVHYAREVLGLKVLHAIAPEINLPSIGVMKKIGMGLDRRFYHPGLPQDSVLNPCVLYALTL